MKEKIIKFILIVSFYVIMFYLCILGIVAIFFMNYYEWMNVVLFLISVGIASLGIYQLIRRKFNFKYLDAKSVGTMILSILIFILPLFYVNTFNKTLFNSCKDNEALLDKKLALIQSKTPAESAEIIEDAFIQNSNNIIKDYNVITDNNSNIYYGTGDYSDSIDVIRDVVSSAKSNKLTKYLKKFQDTEANIVIVNQINKIDNFIDNNTAAYYDPLTGNIVLQSLSKYTSLKAYEGVIFHEYVHYALDVELKDKLESAPALPRWFNEGLATYLEEIYYGPETNEFIIVPVVGDITDDSNFNKSNAFNYYEYSKYLLKYMLDKGGDNFVINLFDDMKITNDIYKSIENILGETVDEIRINMLKVTWISYYKLTNQL